MGAILDEILKNQDLEYKAFTKKLIPVSDSILGLRAPIAKKIARAYCGTKEGFDFLKELPHTYHDENMVHAYMLGYLKENVKKRLDEFLPYVDNWAVCDSLCAGLKELFKSKDEMLPYIEKCILSDKEYIIRFGYVSLLNYYVEERYLDLIFDLTLRTKREEYYIKMAKAWLISVCLVKEYKKTVAWLKEKSLDKWTHNKAIQKATESFRIDKNQKEYLRSIKVK